MQSGSEAAAPEQGVAFDAVVVGAGFAGLYLLHRLRGIGMRVRVYETADNVGGTWYWNRYPGARCDAESLAYSFSFSPELEQEWEWTERYATQPEILRYAEHVAERFGLRCDIRFERRVVSARFDEVARDWEISTDKGDRVRARYCIMATGCLSVPQIPDIPGIDEFAGERYLASQWPHRRVDFTGKRVGVIGTGSSAIQAIPLIAAEARHLTVFQRTPNFSVPARNRPLDPGWVAEFKKHYREHRANHRIGNGQGFGELEIGPKQTVGPEVETGAELSDEALDALLERYWERGGASFIGAIGDTMLDPRSNARVAEFVRRKIREIVHDPDTAEALTPTSHPIGTKRICVDSDYYETYNRANVTLVNLRVTPIERVTAHGVVTDGHEHELDALVLATGFDAMTGALLGIDIRGAHDVVLRDVWAEGPRSYLGLAIAGFPNLFTITGPGSPSVLSNMLVSIEQHVDWLVGLLEHMRSHGFRSVEADVNAQNDWVNHVNEVASATLFPKGGSWYLGANVPGKPRVFMPYAGGVGPYREVCERIACGGYSGFEFSA